MMLMRIAAGRQHHEDDEAPPVDLARSRLISLMLLTLCAHAREVARYMRGMDALSVCLQNSAQPCLVREPSRLSDPREAEKLSIHNMTAIAVQQHIFVVGACDVQHVTGGIARGNFSALTSHLSNNSSSMTITTPVPFMGIKRDIVMVLLLSGSDVAVLLPILSHCIRPPTKPVSVLISTLTLPQNVGVCDGVTFLTRCECVDQIRSYIVFDVT